MLHDVETNDPKETYSQTDRQTDRQTDMLGNHKARGHGRRMTGKLGRGLLSLAL